MKVLQVHNSYKIRGGEEVQIGAEFELLISKGHSVTQYTRDNFEIDNMGIHEVIRVPFQSIWSRNTHRDLLILIENEKPDIAHFHNTFPLISPSAYYACQDSGVPVVQTLHNYRLLCPVAILSRGGRNCTDCVGKFFAWPGVLHGCYHNSRVQSAVTASTISFHNVLRTWQDKVDIYIALTDFAKKLFIKGGIPANKIILKPNFIEDRKFSQEKPGYGIYVGRLAEEKGIKQLVQTWVQNSELNLKIVGTGPIEKELKEMISSSGATNIELVGFVKLEKVLELISGANFLIFPTRVYETFGRVVIEAYSCGVPVVASRIGAVEELVVDGETGLLFDPYDPADMLSKIEWLNSHPDEVARMGKNARHEYEKKYTPEVNYERLMEIYKFAMSNMK